MLEVTRVLQSIEDGDPHAAQKLLPLIYDELRKLAAAKMAQEQPGQTLQATALVHDVYVRLVDVEHAQHWNSRGHFFTAAAEAMRRILVESARRKSSRKRGGDFQRVELDALTIPGAESADELLALHDALAELEKREPEKAKLVNLRFFAGLSIDEAADALQVSRTTAKRHWVYARAWLFGQLKQP